MTYLDFLLTHRRFLGFGFAMALFASFGQTYFIALFSADLRHAFDLGHGGFGTIYAAATITSAAIMMAAGQFIDRIDLRAYSAGLGLCMAGACLYMAVMPAGSLVFLYIGILLLRLTGQGLMSHASSTSMARYFQEGRGKALSIASLGHAAGEAVFPLLAVLLILLLGWRQSWGVIGLVLAVGLVPLTLWLLRGHGQRHADHLERIRAYAATAEAAAQWSRKRVLRDPFFHMILPLLLAPAFINTGVFFNQVHLVAVKGWTLAQFASGFVVYAGAKLVAALLAGPLVDRLGAIRLFPLMLGPLILALLLLAALDSPMAIFAFMLLAGLSQGGFVTSVGALWAEIYGVTHIGSIRAMASSLMVFSTALSPAIMGLAIDAGVSIDHILLACALWVLIGSALAGRAVARRRRRL